MQAIGHSGLEMAVGQVQTQAGNQMAALPLILG
jgi:hypothetical protein